MPKHSSTSSETLISSISSLIESLRNPTAEQVALTDQDLFESFKRIYLQAAQLDREQLVEMLPDENRGVFDVLYLGYTSRAQKGDPAGFSTLVKMVVDYPDFQRLAALSEFNKSPEGYVYGNLGSKVPDAKLVELFSEFAPPLVHNILNSLRAEEFGRLIGYLAASRMEKDIQRYEDMGGQEGLKVSLENWLVEEIRAADSEFVVSCGPNDRLNEATGLFTGDGANPGVRPAGRPDHAIKEYATDPKTGKSGISAIHLGNSTSARRNVALMQGSAALTYLAAAINVSHSTESDLCGVSVKPYYFLHGLFCVDEAVSAGKNLSHALINSDVSRENRIALAQAHYLSMVSCSGKDTGSYSPHPDRTLALLMHNPFISGCDTLDLHGFALQVQDAHAGGLTPQVREKLDRKAMNLLADKIIACSDGLIQAADSLFAKEGKKNDTDSQALVSSVLTLARAFPKAVRFSSPEDLAKLDRVRQAVEKLGNTLEAREQFQWEDGISNVVGAINRQKPAHESLSMGSAMADRDSFTGMPSVGSSALSEKARLRESLRQLGDQLAPELPKTIHSQRFLQVLYASEHSGAFVGLSDARVGWRKDIKTWIGVVKNKKDELPAEAALALETIAEHAFLAKRPHESARDYKGRSIVAQEQLMNGLESLGYGVKPPVPVKVKKLSKRG